MSGAPSSPLRVPDLVSFHEQEAAKRSPSSSPTASRTAPNPLDSPQPGPTSPSPQPKALPTVDSLKLDSLNVKDSTSDINSSQGVSPSGSLVLEDIKEGEPLKTTEQNKDDSDSDGDVDDAAMTESQLFPAASKDNKEEGAKDGEKKAAGEQESSTTSAPKDGKDEAEKSDKPAAVEEEQVDPLEKLRELLESLPEQEQEIVRKNLENIKNYPEELPLSAPWTLHFSDTSGANKSSHGTTQDQYDEGVKKVFSASTVPTLVGQLKAYKKMVRPKRFKANEPDGMGLSRAGQNLHFFREGVSPTWEDAWNAKGGRLIISPPSALFETVFERLVLLLAGSVLECGASERLAASEKKGNEGLIIGVVASRRARGDRIELWLGGKEPRQPAPAEWIDKLKESLSEELVMPELRHGKYKKHFS